MNDGDSTARLNSEAPADSADTPAPAFRATDVNVSAHANGLSASAAGPDPSAPRAEGPDGAPPRPKALIAEDNEINLNVLTAMLRRLGWTFDSARNGAEAVRRACERRYDVILMDCHMPEMDGFQAALRIREALPSAQINGDTPIIAVTADARPENRRQCSEAGMDDYMSKPFRFAELEEMLRRWKRAPARGAQGGLG